MSYLKHWDVNNLYGCAMSQNLRVNGSECVEDISAFNEDFIKSYNNGSDEGYLLDVNSNILDIYITFSQWFTLFPWKNENLKSRKACS